MRPSTFALALLALSAATAPSLASAQDEDPRVAEARRHFELGDEHFEAGRFALSAEEFQRAYGLMREAGHPNAPLVLFNVGRSMEELGRDDEARDAYREFLAAEPDNDELVQNARERLARLGGDGGGGGGEGGGSISPIGPIVMGAGGAALITGLILGGVALAQDGGVGDMCPSRMSCPDSLRGQYDDAQTLALVGDILWISGAVIAATGLVLTLVLHDDSGESATASMSCGPGGCGLSLEGSF